MDDKKKISIGGLRISAPVALIVGIILLFIPTYIAVLLWAGSDDEPLVTKSVSEAVITLPSGETMNSAPSGDNAELLDLLLKMNEKGRSVSSLPNTEELGLQCFKVGYTVYGRQSVYDYYLGENPSECYFVSSYGNTYKIDPESASAFLQLPEAESVYGGSAAPVLTAMGKEITAQAVNWNYKTYNGEYRSSASSFENNYFVNDAGELSLNFGCNFSREPDTVSVTIVDDGGNQIYSGGLTGMAEAVDLDDSVNVVMTISAGWAQAGGVACYGETVYQLRGVLHAPPEFYLNRSEISEGGMVVLSGVNVLNPEGCSISVAPSDSVNYAPYTYKPSFYRDGDHVRALIPVSKDLQNGTCGYTVTVTVENTVYTMNFTATKRRCKPRQPEHRK